jgi:uncharacterized protein with HEPN domain
MKDDSQTHLYDILHAGNTIVAFLTGKTFTNYTEDEMLRSAVERKFEIMGEALVRLRKNDPEALQNIRDYRDIISFRNILIHGYDSIDDQIVWGVFQEDLPSLLEDVQTMLPPESK